MTINNFEENIDTRLLERGLQYYQEGNILTIEQIEEGLWEAIVSGTEHYEVIVELQDERITKSNCSCPFQWTSVAIRRPATDCIFGKTQKKLQQTLKFIF